MSEMFTKPLRDALEIACEQNGGHQFEFEEMWQEGTPENVIAVALYKCKRCGKENIKKDPDGTIWNHPLNGAGCNKCNGQVYMFDLRGNSKLYCKNCGQISWGDTHRY